MQYHYYQDGTTALLLAASEASGAKVARILIKNGAHLNQQAMVCYIHTVSLDLKITSWAMNIKIIAGLGNLIFK